MDADLIARFYTAVVTDNRTSFVSSDGLNHKHRGTGSMAGLRRYQQHG